MDRASKFERRNYRGYQLIVFIVLIIYTVSMFVVVGWGFFTSLKTKLELRTNLFGLPKGFPWDWAWSNYVTVFKTLSITVMAEGGVRQVYLFELMANALIISVVNALIPGWVNVIVSYLTVRFKEFRFSNIIITVTIITMFLPIGASLGVVLQFRKAIGLYDNLFLNLIPAMGWGGTGLFVYRALFMGVGESYCEAAEIDGANEFIIMIKIMFPFIIPTYMSFALMGIVGGWGDYSNTLIWLPSMPTIGYALFNFASSSTSSTSNITMQITACMVTMAPMLILFIIFGDKMMKNINIGGLK